MAKGGREECSKGSAVELLLNEDWLHEVLVELAPCPLGDSTRQLDEFNGRKIIEMRRAMGLDLNKKIILEHILVAKTRGRTREGEKESQKVDQ